jgi:3-hydroxyisobutyrate dehydrogenase-like beta-hydroxyacid dehydrogenase
MNSVTRLHRIAFIGFGEVGSIMGGDLSAAGCEVRAYDTLGELPDQRAQLALRAKQSGVTLADSPASAVRDAELIVCAVTASATRAAAESVAASMVPGLLYLDVNSASPATKISCAQIIQARGGYYIESAVMTSVPPYRIKAPMLLGGPYAERFAPALASLGFAVKCVADKYGVASSIKLCRSVIIKGLEALVIESFTAARACSVEGAVLDSLKETFPQIDWERQADYFFSRVIQHGKRRAEEMRASAEMLEDLGLQGTMASAISERQAVVAAARAVSAFDDPQVLKPWRERADEVLRSYAARR